MMTFLKAFTTVGRFEMTIMLLSKEEKMCIKEAFEYVSSEHDADIPETMDLGRMNTIRLLYGLLPSPP